MRLLLSGASGFIGSHAAPALSDAGHHLRLLARPTSDLSGLDGLPYQRALADLTTDAGLADACHGIDAVVHLAGRIRARTAGEFHEVNARGTARLARAAAAAGVPRFLYLSSLAAQGPSLHGRPLPPTAPPHPITPYGESKAAGEAAALALADRLAVQVLRPPVVYGPRDRGLLPFFKMARWRYCLRLGDGRNRVSMIYGPDLAGALVALLAREPGPSPYFHIADAAGAHTWRELIAALGAAFDHRLLTLPLPAFGFAAAAHLSVTAARLHNTSPTLDTSRVREMRQPAWLADNATLTAHTGWAPRTSLSDGLRATLDWYRAHGWI